MKKRRILNLVFVWLLCLVMLASSGCFLTDVSCDGKLIHNITSEKSSKFDDDDDEDKFDDDDEEQGGGEEGGGGQITPVADDVVFNAPLEEEPDDPLEPVPEVKSSGVRYFGFFHSDGFSSQTSYFKDIASLSCTNIMLVNSAGSESKQIEYLSQAKAMGHKVWLTLHGLTKSGKEGVKDSSALREEWREVIDAAVENLADYIEDGTLYGFYFDEPLWNGIKASDFVEVTKYMREQAPALRVGHCMTAYDIGTASVSGYSEMSAETNRWVTDVMYDDYATWNASQRAGWLNKLKAKSTYNQAIWFVATGFSSTSNTNEIVNSINGVYTEAKNEPRCVGILSYTFANDPRNGMNRFLLTSSPFYRRDVKNIYVDIGREIVGYAPLDHDRDVEIVLQEDTEVYNVGDEIEVPTCRARTGAGANLQYTLTILSPTGEEVEINDGYFTATESGSYYITARTEFEGHTYKKKMHIAVRYPGEVSAFDEPSHLSDATGNKDDIWCWPREIDRTFYREEGGGGSLKVSPHYKDGTWARVVFANRDGGWYWNISEVYSITFWIYSTSDKVIDGFGFTVADKNDTPSVRYEKIISIPSKQWTMFTVYTSDVRMQNPGVNLSNCMLYIGNKPDTYPDRSAFYLDDVMFNAKKEGQEDEQVYFSSFDDATTINDRITAKDGWTVSLNTTDTFVNSGEGSVKVTPESSGNNPELEIKLGEGETIDASKLNLIKFNIYNTSSHANFDFGITVSDGENSATLPIALRARAWTVVNLLLDDFTEISPDLDLSSVRIYLKRIANTTYSDRSVFYLDDFTVSKDASENKDTAMTRRFEAINDFKTVATGEGWTAISFKEQVYKGERSLMIIPKENSNGNYLTFKNKNGGTTFNITDYNYISLWTYFISNNATRELGIIVSDGTHTAEKAILLSSRKWSLFSITVNEILEKAPDMDLSKVTVSFGVIGETYDDVSAILIDEFEIASVDLDKTENAKEAEEFTVKFSQSFEGDTSAVGNNAEDIWTWPVSIATNNKHGGNSSLKVTPRQDGGKWPNVVIRNGARDTFNMSDATVISMWVYFDSDNEKVRDMGFNITDGIATAQKTFTVYAREWTKISITVDEILAVQVGSMDLTSVYIKFSQMGADYVDKCVFYLDDFKIEKPAGGEEEIQLPLKESFDTEESLSTIYGNTDDLWAWVTSIDGTRVKAGTGALKVTPRQDGGTWPILTFNGNQGCDLTGYDSVSLWVYFDSNNSIDTLGFLLNRTNGKAKTFAIPSRTWTKIEISVDEIAAMGIDITNVTISFAQLGGTYTDRSVFYLDELKVNKYTSEDTPTHITFDNEMSLSNIYGSESDLWCWRISIDELTVKDGDGALKINPHPTDGTWPSVTFNNNQAYDLTGYEAVSLWVYFDSDSAIDTLGIMFNGNGATSKTFSIPSRTWTKIEVTVAEIEALGVDTTSVKISFAQLGGTYTDRSNIYIDEFDIR